MPTFVDLTTRSGIEEKERKLLANLSAMGRVIVAFSGGTDSAYLAWAANRALGANAVAITADSASLPESHKRDAEAFVERFGIVHEYVATQEFDNPDYVRNGPDRCFHCKDELFTRLEGVGRERGYQHIIYGVNVDDLGDYRPGQNAATAHTAYEKNLSAVVRYIVLSMYQSNGSATASIASCPSSMPTLKVRSAEAKNICGMVVSESALANPSPWMRPKANVNDTRCSCGTSLPRRRAWMFLNAIKRMVPAIAGSTMRELSEMI